MDEREWDSDRPSASWAARYEAIPIQQSSRSGTTTTTGDPVSTRAEHDDNWHTFGDLVHAYAAHTYIAFRRELDGQLDRLRALRPGWDSYNARPVDIATLDRAREFVVRLASLPSRIQPQLFVTPTVRGGISLEWQDGPKELTVRFTPHEWNLEGFLADDSANIEQEFAWSPSEALRLIAAETRKP